MPGKQPTGRPVTIANRYPRLTIDRRLLIRAIATLDAHHRALATPSSKLDNAHELSVAFLTDSELAALHGTFLDDPTTTDVITFEGDPAMNFAGEICVSVDTARSYAKAHGSVFADELLLYVAHGWLHLAGHDDLAPAVKRRMRRAEAEAMGYLRAAGCRGLFSLSKSRTA